MKILITGASKGLGLELAKCLHNEEVINVSNTKVEGVKNILGDLTKDSTIKKIDQEINHLDVLINNAGKLLIKELDKTTDKEIDNLFDINVLSPIKLTRTLIPKLRKGLIINILSTSAKNSKPKESIYCATKFALRGFSDAIRKEYPDIRVISVYPGGMKTTIFDRYNIDTKKFMDPKKVAEAIIGLLYTDPNISPDELVINRMKNG